jgi:hypothetical protein
MASKRIDRVRPRQLRRYLQIPAPFPQSRRGPRPYGEGIPAAAILKVRNIEIFGIRESAKV